MNKFLTKISRISAYILILLFVLIAITGYRQVGQFTFISRGLASSLHQIYLNIAILFFGAVHALIAIRDALRRNKIKGLYIDMLLILLGFIFVGGFSYFALF